MAYRLPTSQSENTIHDMRDNEKRDLKNGALGKTSKCAHVAQEQAQEVLIEKGDIRIRIPLSLGSGGLRAVRASILKAPT